MRPRRLAAVLLAVLLATVGAVGCGSDDGSAAPSVSKAEFLRRANAVCERHRRGLMGKVAAYERLHVGDDPSDYADAVHWVFLPAIDAAIQKLYELRPPPGEDKRIELLLRAQKGALDILANRPKVPSVEAAERGFAKSGRQLRAYGLSACAVG